MHLQATQNLDLIDSQQQTLGQVAVQRTDGGLVVGRFFADPAFDPTSQLFRDYEEAVNHQALTEVDRLDGKISALGLRIVLSDGQQLEVRDVQIWSDGGITFRHLDGDPLSEATRVAGSPTAT